MVECPFSDKEVGVCLCLWSWRRLFPGCACIQVTKWWAMSGHGLTLHWLVISLR